MNHLLATRVVALAGNAPPPTVEYHQDQQERGSALALLIQTCSPGSVIVYKVRLRDANDQKKPHPHEPEMVGCRDMIASDEEALCESKTQPASEDSRE